jgi:hypothetical protein
MDFWDGDEFQAKAKDSQCGCRDNLLGHVVMKLLVGEMGKIDPLGGFAQHMTCIQMGGDCKIGNKSVVLAGLPHRLIGYLCNFVGFTTFFPSNDTFSPLDFFFPLARMVAFLFTPRSGGQQIGWTSSWWQWECPCFSGSLGGSSLSCCPRLFWGIFATLNGFQLILKGLETAFDCQG